ncbi:MULTISPECIES: hypothetical protein [Mycobacterium]|uniref:hypothetical protein n=1 Tax=Mycobacterium TaxID=1763 RepID=UPI001150984E|nr:MULTISPECIES: hypothetical protein [Mycobacterium]MCV7005597.1 hypothetical protein [Mycobacterium gordonae]
MSAYSIAELYDSTPAVESDVSSTRNPLIEQGALDEAELIDVRLSPQRSRAGAIFDIRWCGFTGSNVALVVIKGVGKVAWANDVTSRQKDWYSTRGYWAPSTSENSRRSTGDPDPLWAADADSPEAVTSETITPPAERLQEYVLGFDWLSLSGLAARMYIGYAPGLGDAPPDMTELSDAEIIAGYPQWSSAMEVREYYTYSSSEDIFG